MGDEWMMDRFSTSFNGGEAKRYALTAKYFMAESEWLSFGPTQWQCYSGAEVHAIPADILED